ncbi:hypothetical protein Mag101_12940 [Microbulbifer agarilyticus]|uniref:DNA-binding response regulator n=1 Tax=Microbulbifer agarilyticus TaxID=260552 RepID=A0A1Q2M819_9GAMM|nr:LytTR family DNA-binding domain-containing protein [Microbulbifer agarilyticus]AQQ68437.1 hypothetical protein Mag101_12940 [Microbulbifer agarilyticus]
MPTAIIADDEPLLRMELADALENLWPELRIIEHADNGAKALRYIEEYQPDIAFLDIRMPSLDGLEVADQVREKCQVVFVTAYDEHAVTAFEQGAIDYVLKPIKMARLAATVSRLRQRLSEKPASDETSSNEPLQWVRASSGNSLRFFPVQDIVYFRSDGKYTKIVTSDDQALIREPLRSLGQTLDSKIFWRINRGIIVNLSHISHVTRDDEGKMTVHLQGEATSLPVSKNHQSQFRGM